MFRRTSLRRIAEIVRGFLLLASAAFVVGDSLPADQPGAPATVAEASDYELTARYAEVVEFVRELDQRSPRVLVDTLGDSHEGRSIPLVVVADPPIAADGVWRSTARRGDDRLRVLLFGNIHAGEVCGKEALLALARDLALAPERGLLEHLVIGFVPIYNVDGNERVSKDHRPGQVGPAGGTGVRHNAQGFDLNRDWTKLDAPETRAFVRLLRRWDPSVIIDTHTTNGSHHRYVLTYAGPKHPAGDPGIIELVRDRLLPDVTARLAERGTRTWFYGNFSADRTAWETYPDGPRFGTPYRGLRGRVAILSEAYAYATYRDRVIATREFTLECLRWASERRAEIAETIRRADERARDGARVDLPLVTRAVPREDRFPVAGWVEEETDGVRRPTNEPRDYDLELVDRFVPVSSVARPAAYLIPEREVDVIQNLLRHGVEVDILREDVELDVEILRVASYVEDAELWQGRVRATIGVDAEAATRRITAGTRVVRTAQALGTLAAYLLEPAATDGLASCGFFAGRIDAGAEFPILRLPEPSPLRTAREVLEEDRDAPHRVTFERVWREGVRPPSASPAFGFDWIDEEHWIERKDGRSWRVRCDSGRAEEEPDRSDRAAVLAALPEITEEEAARLVRGARVDDRRQGAWVEHERDLYWFALEEDVARRLTSTPELEELATFSPDGRWVAFVRENDLWVVDVASARERRLTTGGGDTLRHGKASWVYFEEVFGRSWQTFWWSPDSRRIAFLEIDSSDVPTFPVVDLRPDRPNVEVSTYPKPGDPNPRARVGVIGVAGGEIAWGDLSAWDPADTLLTGVGWRPDGRAAWVFVQDRIQSWLEVVTLSPLTGAIERLARLETGAWVEPPEGPFWLESGEFLLTSEHTGWKHIYRHAADGERVATLTEGEFEVRHVHRVDEANGQVYFTGTKDSPIAEHFYRVPLAGGVIQRLTHEPGHHVVSLSPEAGRFVAAWSSHREPGRSALFAADGTLLRRLDTNPAPELRDWIWLDREHFDVPAPDGTRLAASWILPAGFDPARRYPVWFSTYGGPHAPSVRDSWSGGALWDQALANSGIVVFHADPRAASGRGACSTWTSYRRLGLGEVEDVRAAIEWLAQRPWVDASRIGISGHSFGGYLTAFAMTRTKLFAAGIAGAPVTDWRDYDTIYTERYMQTRRLNPEGYEQTSVVAGAANLHGRLLILHGTIDDNVHLQNTMRLVQAFQRADVDVELMLYPGFRHGIGGRHYDRLRWEFIQRTLHPSAAGPRGEE